MMPGRACLPVVLAALLLVLGACTGTSAPPSLLPVAREPLPPARTAGATDYRIDATRSQLRVLVHRGGPLAALGHNHVIVDDALAGWIRLGQPFEASAFYLELAPGDFVVDPPEARAQEGADFAEPVDDDARTGTRRNMLRAGQLDAADFPQILVRSVSVQRPVKGASIATLRVTVAGHTRLLTLPFTLQQDGDALRVSVQVPLRQTALGLEPLKVLMGQLQVEDGLELKLRILALPVQPGAG
jgi:polyisoprenoid-binding protein YceI